MNLRELELGQHGTGKFFRLENGIWITHPGDTATLHVELAKESGIAYPRLMKLREGPIDNVNLYDAGTYILTRDGLMKFGGDSSYFIALRDAIRQGISGRHLTPNIASKIRGNMRFGTF